MTIVQDLVKTLITTLVSEYVEKLPDADLRKGVKKAIFENKLPIL